MKPEHEQCLRDHMATHGFVSIIDRLKDQFPDLAHKEACSIYDEFKVTNADDPAVKRASAGTRALAEQMSKVFIRLLNPDNPPQGEDHAY